MKILTRSTLPLPFLFLLFILGLVGCNFKVNDPIQWDVDLLGPIAKSSVSLRDAISDTNDLRFEDAPEFNDRAISLSFRDTLSRTRLIDLVEIPDTSTLENFDLSTFRLADQNTVQQVTLAQIARGLEAQGNILGTLILNNHNQSFPLPVQQNGLSTPDIPIDASDLFEFAALSGGEIVVTIVNNLPVDIRNLSFELNNQNRGDKVLEGNFPLVAAQDSVQEIYDMTDREIESSLLASLLNLDIESAGGFMIDTTDALVIKLLARDLQAKEATAIFPSQTVDEQETPLTYEFTGDYADVALTYLRVKSGRIRAELFSTIEDTIQVEYSIPSATLNGEIPVIRKKIPPARPGAPSSLVEVLDLSGYEMDLTFDGTRTNTLRQRYKVDLVFSGKLVNIDSTDEVSIQYGLEELVPAYAEGYFGQNTFEFLGVESLGVFDEFDIEALDIANPSATLHLLNSAGVDMQLNFLALVGVNIENGEQRRFESIELGNPIDVPGIVLPDTFGFSTKQLVFNRGNSNIREVLNIQPDQLEYAFEVTYNPFTLPSSLGNFGTSESEVIALLDLDIPLEGSITNYKLVDSSEVDFGNNELEDVQQANVRLLLENYYPLALTANAFLLDANLQPLDTLAYNFPLQAASPDERGYVVEPQESTLQKQYTGDALDRILREARILVLEYRIDSKPEGTPVKLYDNYRIDGTLLGEFTYSIND